MSELIEGDEITEMSAEARRRLSAMARILELKIDQWEPEFPAPEDFK
jgi:hypothetical protein